MNHTKTGRPPRGSRVPANTNGKATRQAERESERQPLRSHSQHQERRDMNHNKTSRECYKCGESHSTSDCRHHSRRILNKLKCCLPQDTLYLLYNSLVLSHLNYGILAWGYQTDRLYKLQ